MVCLLCKNDFGSHDTAACVGTTSKIGDHVMRIVAVQTAGNTGDLRVWVNQMAIHLRAMGPRILVFTETRIHEVDRHTQVVNIFPKHGLLDVSKMIPSGRRH